MSWLKRKPPAFVPFSDVVGKHAGHSADKIGVLHPHCDACRPLLVENIARCAEVGWSREFMRTVLADVDAA